MDLIRTGRITAATFRNHTEASAMNYFTRDNTEGYSVHDLDRLNRMLEAALDCEPMTDADDDIRDSHVKNLAAMVLDDYGQPRHG
jgi:hypothetical protein